MTEHRIICDGRPLGYRERMERPWHCSCGKWSTYGYDRDVFKAFREHKRQSR